MARDDELPTAREEPESGAQLLIMDGTVHRVFPLPPSGTIQLGRSSSAEVPLADTSVSRRHAVLHLGPAMAIEDLGSSRGTLVNNLRVKPGERAPVSGGDVLRIGSVVVLVQGGPSPPRPVESGEVVVASPVMQKVHDVVTRAARSNINVLLLGETGAGKEVVARAVHDRSPRASQPFVGINCAALSELLLESELFGHEKGAFTGAIRAKPGLFEHARRGTVFLDEVGEMSPAIQAKLLRVLEERAVLRVGGLEPRAIDVRFVVATNKDLEVAVRDGSFRHDLYFRLNGISILVPPLRERREEIAPLARLFARRFASQAGWASEPRIEGEALALLEGHAWPGNVRELRNVIERAVILGEGKVIAAHNFPDGFAPGKGRAPVGGTQAAPPAGVGGAPAGGTLGDELHEIERRKILEALEACAGNQTRAAKLLGIPRRTFTAKLTQYNVPRPRRP